jgi:hypothetical protein
MLPSLDPVAIAAMERAIAVYAEDGDLQRLAASIRAGVSALRDDPFGAVEAEEVARLVNRRWQILSNHDQTLRAFAAGRLPTFDSPLDLGRVLRAAVSWADRIVEGELADALPPARATPEELMMTWGISRATAYRVFSRPQDAAYGLRIWVRARRRQAVAQLVAGGRSKAAARRLVHRHPELIADPSAAPTPRSRRS